MKDTSLMYFDGQKAVNLLNNPDAWTILTGGSSETEDVQKYYKTVPWLWRGVDLRANAIASLPFAIVNQAGDEIDTSDDYQNKLGFLPNPANLLFLTEASLTLLGRSYLFRARNLVKLQ